MNLRLAIGLGWLSRIVGMLAIIVNTRLLVQLVHVDGLAAHAIVASFSTWLALMNLGLPSSVQNLISRWRAKARPLNILRETTSSITLLLAVGFLPIVLLAAFVTHRYLLSGYAFVSLLALSAAFVCLFVGGLGAVYMSMLHAEHRSVWPNLYPGVTGLAVFVLLTTFKYVGIDDFNLILALYFLPNALFAVLGFALLRMDRRLTFNRSAALRLRREAKGFASIATLGTLTLGLDYVILSRLLPPEDVAAYSLTSKMFLVVQAIHAVVLNSAWTPLSDLFFAGKRVDARKRAFQLGLTGVLLAAGWSIVVVIGAPFFYRVLAPGTEIHVPPGFLGLWVAYIMMRTWSDSFYIVLQSFGDTTALRRYIVYQAPISIGLQFVMGSWLGMQGVLLGIALSFLLTCVWYLPMRTYALTKAL